jgi:hypothetical protein
MLTLRRAAWALPITLAALAVALLAAVIVARQGRQPLVRPPAPHAIADKGSAVSTSGVPPSRTPPQKASFDAEATYGVGLTNVVPSPVAALKAQLGDEWRELGSAVGRLLVRPGGTRSRYFEIGMVAVAPQGSARLEILTSTDQKGIAPVYSGALQVINFGPFLAPKHGRTGVALKSVQPHDAKVGARLLLSPLQAEYLAPGEAVMRMPALAELGTNGLRGMNIPSGVKARFQVTPGISGRCMVTLKAAGIGGTLRVTAVVGNETHSVFVGSRPTVLHIGPFSHPGADVSLNVSRGRYASTRLFLSDVRLTVAGPHA